MLARVVYEDDDVAVIVVLKREAGKAGSGDGGSGGSRATLRVLAMLVAAALRASGARSITVQRLARMLGVPAQLAGMLLAEMEKAGLALRWSKRTYMLKHHGRGGGGMDG